MANDKTLLYVGIAGAAGFGLYYYLRNEYHYKLVTMTMPTMSQPSFWEILLGSAQAELAKARMLDDAMKPFIEDRQAVLGTQQNKEAATKVYNDFIGRHPDAVVHQDAIAQLLEKDANLNA